MDCDIWTCLLNRLVIRRPYCFAIIKFFIKNSFNIAVKCFVRGEAVLTASECLSTVRFAWLFRHAFNVK